MLKPDYRQCPTGYICRLTALGTGTPNVNKGQVSSSYLFELGDGQVFLFDVGTDSIQNLYATGIDQSLVTKVRLDTILLILAFKKGLDEAVCGQFTDNRMCSSYKARVAADDHALVRIASFIATSNTILRIIIAAVLVTRHCPNIHVTDICLKLMAFNLTLMGTGFDLWRICFQSKCRLKVCGPVLAGFLVPSPFRPHHRPAAPVCPGQQKQAIRGLGAQWCRACDRHKRNH